MASSLTPNAFHCKKCGWNITPLKDEYANWSFNISTLSELNIIRQNWDNIYKTAECTMVLKIMNVSNIGYPINSIAVFFIFIYVTFQQILGVNNCSKK